MTKEAERGTVVVWVALAMTAILSAAALTMDVGQLAFGHERLSDVASAAALSGATKLPDDPTGAQQTAVAIAEQNGVPANRVQTYVNDRHDELRVDLEGFVPFHLAAVWGNFGQAIRATATAKVGVAGGTRGALPWGVQQGAYTPGQAVLLKAGGGEGTRGNYFALALGGTGAENYRINIRQGYPHMLRIGDQVETEPGNMAGPTRDGVNERTGEGEGETCTSFKQGSRRVAVVPVVNFSGVQGRSTVTVLGFATFFIIGMQGDDVWGCFIRYNSSGVLDEFGTAPDYGLHVIQLVH